MKNSEILIKAKEIIADPASWRRVHRATDRNGKVVPATSKSAVCFCAVGAVERALNFKSPINDDDAVYRLDVVKILDSVVQNLKNYGNPNFIWQFNDRHATKHADVLDVFDKAIRVAKAKEISNNH